VGSSGVLALFGPLASNYSFSFPSTGTFHYMCRIHDHMVGTIVVNAAQTTTTTTPPVLAQTGASAPRPMWPLAALAGALLMLLGVAVLRLRPKILS
jgi:hypothetical protein